MTFVTERVPLDEINSRAREVRFGRTLLTLIAAVFFAVGWLVAKMWLALAWCAVAVKVGWQEGRAQVQEQRPGRPA